MSRAEKRAMKRNGLSDRDIRAIEDEKLYQEAFKKGMREASSILFYMTAYTINYKLSFGRDRLQRIMRAIYNNVDAFRTGHLTPEDYQDIKKQMHELGVKMI